MKAAILAITLACAGCASPIAPTRYVCATQPREYWNPNTGVTTTEIDHYESDTVCPATPIK